MELNPNQDVKKFLKASPAKKWQVANELKVAESTLNNWLHRPLSKDKKERVMAAIKAVNEQVKAAK